jgi:hypothetical protein
MTNSTYYLDKNEHLISQMVESLENGQLPQTIKVNAR